MATIIKEQTMAYPIHYLLAFGGNLGDDEQWSCSLRMTSASMQLAPKVTIGNVAESVVDEVVTKVQQFMTDAGGYWHKDAMLQFVKFNGIDEEGLYISDETTERQNLGFRAPQSSSGGPFQISTAITLKTGLTRGLAVNGRFFVPTSVPVITRTGHTDPQFAVRWAEASRTFINSLNNWAGPDFLYAPDVCVVSRGKRLGPKTWGEGKWARVETVGVGNVLDTQRSRRRSLVETYEYREIDS